MEPGRKSFSSRQHGNAMVYVLIAVALFAALTLLLARQGDTGEKDIVGENKTKVFSTQIIQTSMQVKQTIDQMVYSGSDVSSLDFTTPDTEPAFSTPPHINKIFHPEGGGVILPRLSDEAVNQVSADPPAQWYVGRFNNTAWSATAANDVVLVAHQIKQDVCAAINEKLTGSAAIPVATAAPRDFLINDTLHTGANAAFDAPACAGCDGFLSLCIEAPTNDSWTFYSIIAPQ